MKISSKQLNEFLTDLADVMEKHGVYIVANTISDGKRIFGSVGFQSKGEPDLFPDLKRCHVSAYDLRCESGMTSAQANGLYHKNEALKQER